MADLWTIRPMCMRHQCRAIAPEPINGLSNRRSGARAEELSIKTHYEGLDIAQSNRIHYLCFSLPTTALPQIDSTLHQRCKEDESAAG